jgi:hypothetical protein
MNFPIMSEVEQAALAEELAANVERMREPSREDVIGCLIENGMPPIDAERQMQNSGLEGFARQFYIDAQDARLGHDKAKERVERCREVWGQMSDRRRQQEAEQRRTRRPRRRRRR